MNEAKEWICFHCGGAFWDEDAARQHFGPHEGRVAACVIKASEGGLLRALREAEDEVERVQFALHEEGAEGLKALRANQSRHQAALRSVEETAYERGLAMQGYHPATSEQRTAIMEWIDQRQRLKIDMETGTITQDQARLAYKPWKLMLAELGLEQG